MGESFIEKSPAVVKTSAAVADAQKAVADAREAAITANSKADQSLAGQARIYTLLQQSHEDTQSIRVSIASLGATLTTSVTDLAKQVDRIQSRQDNGK